MLCLLVLECVCYLVSQRKWPFSAECWCCHNCFCLFCYFNQANKPLYFWLGETNLESQESPHHSSSHCATTGFHFCVPDPAWPILLLLIIFVILVLSLGNIFILVSSFLKKVKAMINFKLQKTGYLLVYILMRPVYSMTYNLICVFCFMNYCFIFSTFINSKVL